LLGSKPTPLRGLFLIPTVFHPFPRLTVTSVQSQKTVPTPVPQSPRVFTSHYGGPDSESRRALRPFNTLPLRGFRCFSGPALRHEECFFFFENWSCFSGVTIVHRFLWFAKRISYPHIRSAPPDHVFCLPTSHYFLPTSSTPFPCRQLGYCSCNASSLDVFGF